jgi:tripartite-type tricarboxylate transporter receptor subunit TctC
MRTSVRKDSIVAVFAGMLAFCCTNIFAPARAEWPEHPITIIVPFSEGGHTDMVGRLLAAQLASRFGQNVKVENRMGASAPAELSTLLQATAFGYTLAVTSNATLASATMDAGVYDLRKDFAPIAYLGAAPNVIVTGKSSSIASLQDLIAKAKANPGKLTYSSPGVGTSAQLAVELLKIRAKIDITHVPFNGSGMSLIAALSGTTDISGLNTLGLMHYIQSGELKALAQTGMERWTELPDVPTLAESGFPNAVLDTSLMILAPAGTPNPIIDKLAEKTQEILQQPDVKAKLLETGFVVNFEGPDALRARIAREMKTLNEVVERIGLKKKR